MRDPKALEIELRIEHEIFREISREQFVIFSFEGVQGQRVAAFFDLVDDPFKFGEHCLPEQCAANVVDLPINDVSAHFWIARLAEQMMGEQFFIECRRHFGEKNRVIVILILLRFLGEPGVHRMAGLVCERVNIGKHIFLVIHEDVGRSCVTSG